MDPVASEIAPVTAGAMTEDVIPKKLNTPYIVATDPPEAKPESQEMMIGSTASLPKNPYATIPMTSSVWLPVLIMKASMAAAMSSSAMMMATLRSGSLSASRAEEKRSGDGREEHGELATPTAVPSKPRSVSRKLGNHVSMR